MSEEMGTRENPCTSENSKAGQRLFKFCLCDLCKIVNLCTPNNDFWEVGCGPNEGKLACDSCFDRQIFDQVGHDAKIFVI